ncbi:hypothetical protein [Pseudomonas sp. URIL14HWK12:I5]|uniref:hypothetical protein n=1 Tax=Pseudomonas sp. URIL14HWK12:I5 TaxID=1261630 RepID=UPI0009D85A5A|nr:hypothetical protein [Pseudomonas sp. URIL14HWK12:I5]SMD00441.1 hypothetical protein SAMN05660385_03652 [Pseudomonas sp. URIL14HWK12:I5]
MRDLGNAGEDQVKAWCALSGITANKAVIDRYGWDLLFEMPSGFGLATASGLHQSAYECKVQVKTTDGGPKGLSIELSNLHAMATTTFPSFYLLVDYDGGDVPKSAHLVHIDESLCSRILERIRRETAEDNNVKLNKKTMSLDFASAPRLQSLNGEGLKQAIVECIGASQSVYVANKQQHLASAGYGEGALSVSFTVDEEDIKRFVDMAIGDESRLEVKDFRSFETRFGIRDNAPLIQSETALISIEDAGPKELGSMVFRNPKDGTKVEWEADVYRAAMGEWVPAEHRKMRMRAPRFTIDIRPDGKEITFWFHKRDKDQSTVKDLIKHYQLLTMLQEPEGAKLSLFARQRELNATMSIHRFKCDYTGALKSIKDVQRLQGEFGYHDDLNISPNELGEKQVAIAGVLMLSSDENSGEDLRSSSIASTKNDGVRFVENIIPGYVQLGEIHFLSLILVKGELVQSGADYELIASSRRLIYRTYGRDDVHGLKMMVDEIQACVSNHHSGGIDTDLIEEFMDYLRDLIRQKELGK